MDTYLVLLSTSTEQSLNGIKEVIDRTVLSQRDLPFDRQKLMTFPIPTRIDTQTEFKIAQEWLDRFSNDFAKSYEDWMPKAASKKKFIELIKIPYIPFFSFGEQLPVIVQGTSDPAGIGYAYENIAGLLANNLEMAEILIEKRNQFIQEIKKGKGVDINFGDKDKINIYISYSRKDEEQVNKLIANISILKSLHNVIFWSEAEILPGDDWQKKINEHIEKSNIFLFIVSPSFLASDFVHKELKKILQSKKDHPIIPILLKPSGFLDSELSKFQPLPENGVPISINRDEDSGYIEITRSLNSIIENYKKSLISITQDENEKIKEKLSDSNKKISDSLRYITRLVSQGDINNAFSRFNHLLDDFQDMPKNYKTKIVLLSSGYNRLKQQSNINAISKDYYNTSLNSITVDLINLIYEIEEMVR